MTNVPEQRLNFGLIIGLFVIRIGKSKNNLKKGKENKNKEKKWEIKE